MSVALRPVQGAEVAVLSRFIECESQWFEFNPAVDWLAQGPDQWCYGALAKGELVGFGRLSVQSNLGAPAAVASYGVFGAFRRRGYGRAIVRALGFEAEVLELPLLAAVLSTNNIASLGLCRRVLGVPLWTGLTPGGAPAVVFGDHLARRVFCGARS